MSKALTSGDISAHKDDKGRWQIDPSELQRWINANPLPNKSDDQLATPTDHAGNINGNSALAIEVRMLREKIEDLNLERQRERQNLIDQIEDLKAAAERQSREHIQALALLTDQRERTVRPSRRGLWARLVGQGT